MTGKRVKVVTENLPEEIREYWGDKEGVIVKEHPRYYFVEFPDRTGAGFRPEELILL